MVGTGVRFVRQITEETRDCLVRAQQVLHLVDPATADWIRSLNPASESLAVFLAEGKSRAESYEEMVEQVLSFVRLGLDVCAAFYGHPAFFCAPSQSAIHRAREEGYSARMLPGISPQDCLYADLGMDPGRNGIQSFDINVFLKNKKRIEPASPLLLWQTDVLDERKWSRLREILLELYSGEHILILYDPPLSPVADPRIGAVRIADLAEVATRKPFAAVYVPAGKLPERNLAMYERLGLKR